MKMECALRKTLLLLVYVLFTVEVTAQQSHLRLVTALDSIQGKPENLSTPFVTAGNRVYMVGFQNGQFPDLGWHITGEMGGIWNHPIKLMDGFDVSLTNTASERSLCLNNADRFINYPVGNSHSFAWNEEKISIRRFQFVPDNAEGMVVEYEIINHGDTDKEIRLEFTGRVDLRPTWLGEKTNMVDTRDNLRYDGASSTIIAKDDANTWFAAFGSSLVPDKFEDRPGKCSRLAQGLGKEGTLIYTIRLKRNGGIVTIPFFIAGSYKSEEALRKTFRVLKTQSEKKLKEKIERFKIIRNTTRLVLPDQEITRMYDWLKFNTDWLVREVPEIGVGLSAGLPDYPWWFGCDNTYALQGVLASGNHALAKKTIELLTAISSTANNNNGRIIHEVSTNGAVFNYGNVNETAQFIHLVWVYYTWTGDKELIARLYPFLKNGVKWLKEMDPDGNQYPNGNGMMEIHGLDTEMIDVVVYTQQALTSMALLATELKDDKAAELYRREANELKTKINTEWWSDDAGSYADFRASDAATLPIVEAAIVRADTLNKVWSASALREYKAKLDTRDSMTTRAQVVYRNWVVNTPMETGVAERQKGLEALKTSRQYENAFGSYVTGIDRSIEPDSIVLASRKKVFSYTGAVMTLPTAVQAIGAANLGETDLSLEFIRKLHASFSYALPGSMYEVSPDFGMFTQAWNIYGVAVPIIQKFIGVQPMAHRRTVVISPDLPESWEDAAVNDLKVGTNSLSVSLQKNANSVTGKIVQKDKSWNIVFAFEKMPSRVLLNGKIVDEKLYSNRRLDFSGGENEIQVFYK